MARSKYSQWYSTKRWRAIRAEQLQREPLCAYCQSVGRLNPANIADHIEPHRGDLEKFWTGKLQSLCGTCHSGAKQQEEGGKVGFDEQGNPLAPLGHWR